MSFKNFNNIQPGEYHIREFSKVELEDFFCYSPSRFDNFIKETDLEELNAVPQVMVYKGKDSQRKNRLILDFGMEVRWFDDRTSCWRRKWRKLILTNAFNIAHKLKHIYIYILSNICLWIINATRAKCKKIVVIFYFNHFSSGTLHHMLSCDRTHILQLHLLTSVSFPK